MAVENGFVQASSHSTITSAVAKTGERLEPLKFVAAENPMKKRIAPSPSRDSRIVAYGATAAEMVRFKKLEKKSPNAQKKTAFTTSIRPETSSSSIPTPPSRKASAWIGRAVRMSRNR